MDIKHIKWDDLRRNNQCGLCRRPPVRIIINGKEMCTTCACRKIAEYKTKINK